MITSWAWIYLGGKAMPIYDSISKAMRDNDVDVYVSHMSDDFKFMSHQTGEVRDRETSEKMIRGMMQNGMQVTDQRCLYENDDILVSHSKMTFPDGHREAVMSVATKKDGKITRLETGATPI
jgi:ketosteroid isomerase-like protein